MTIDALINLPARTQTESVFSNNADNIWPQLNTFGSQVNAAGVDIVARQADVTAKQSAAATSASTATTQANLATAASAAAQAAANTAGAVAWVSGATYAVGDLAYSPINFANYRRKVSGAGTIDPSLDKTNWANAAANTGIETGALLPMPIVGTPQNVLTINDSGYLKAGVQVTRASAISAGYDVTELESKSACSPMSATIPFVSTDMAFGAGVFVIVGTTGQIATSADGITWATRTSGTTDNLNVIEFVNGLFVASGTNWLGSSPDGITWTARTCPVSGSLKTAISFINGKYVIGCNTGSSVNMIQWSTDLATWTAFTGAKINQPNNVVFFIDKFYWVNSAGDTIAMDLSGAPKIVDTQSTIGGVMSVMNGTLFKFATTGTTGRKTADGVTWSNFTCNTASVSGGYSAPTFLRGGSTGIYANSVYVATSSGGFIQSSPDGITWTNRAITGQANVIYYLGGQFLAIGGTTYTGSAIKTSTDGITWTNRSIAGDVNAIAYSGSIYVAVGQNGANQIINSSTDGATWTNRLNNSISDAFSDVVYGNGTFVAMATNGSGYIYYSTNGTTWSYSTIAGVGSYAWNTIKFLNGYFIITSASIGKIYYSTDGINWTLASSILTPSATYNNSQSTATIADFSNGKYWGFSSSILTVGTSINNWFISYNNNGFAASTTVKIKSSGNRLLAFGSCLASYNTAGSLLVSGDGVAWSSLQRPSDLTTDASIPSDFTFANNNFVITFGNKVSSSADGSSWVSTTMQSATTAVYGLAYGGGTWWFTGNNGYAYTTTNLSTYATRYGASTTPLTIVPVKACYGNGIFIGLNVSTGTSISISPDGYTGNIGVPVSLQVTTGITYYLKVK